MSYLDTKNYWITKKDTRLNKESMIAIDWVLNYLKNDNLDLFNKRESIKLIS